MCHAKDTVHTQNTVNFMSKVLDKLKNDDIVIYHLRINQSGPERLFELLMRTIVVTAQQYEVVQRS